MVQNKFKLDNEEKHVGKDNLPFYCKYITVCPRSIDPFHIVS